MLKPWDEVSVGAFWVAFGVSARKLTKKRQAQHKHLLRLAPTLASGKLCQIFWLGCHRHGNLMISLLGVTVSEPF
jgi:hypothetical protein